MKFKSLFEFCATFIMLTAGIGDYIYCIFNKTIPGVIWIDIAYPITNWGGWFGLLIGLIVIFLGMVNSYIGCPVAIYELYKYLFKNKIKNVDLEN